MAASSSSLVPVKQRDYLENDPPIRGQAFVCLSIITPENVLDLKEPFFFSKYLGRFATEIKTMFDVLKQKYPAEQQYLDGIVDANKHFLDAKELQEAFRMFSKLNEGALEEEFTKLHDFRTTVRGLKIRGTYASIDEAKARASKLQKGDPKHNVWVAEVGAWVPFADNPEEMKDMEYAETALNTLMKKYDENASEKDEFFKERKHVMGDGREPETPQFRKIFEDADPWLAEKREPRQVERVENLAPM